MRLSELPLTSRFCRTATYAVVAASLVSTSVRAQSSSQANTDATETLPTVVVTGRPDATKPGALSGDIVRTESINAQEIANTGATNLTELMSHRPGIDVQVECAVCNVRNITLNNLPGRFTTVLMNGIPIFSSVSNAYGLDMLGVNGLERVDVARGAGTSLIAPDSLAGTVNLVSKHPSADRAEVDVSGGNFDYKRLGLYGAKTFTGGAVTVTASLDKHDSVDGAGNLVSQYTGYDRKLFGGELFLDDIAGFRMKARVDHIDEKRMGGPLGSDYDAVFASTSGNPFDFSKGPHASPDKNAWINPADGTLVDDYADGAFGLAQIVFTKRDQLVSTADREIGGATLHLAAAYAKHRQDSWYGGDAEYFGRQNQAYFESSLKWLVGSAQVTAGFNYRFEDLHSRSKSLDPGSPNFNIQQVNSDKYTYRTPGAFVQVYETFFDERLEANASVRYDDNNVYGSLITPRLNLLWHHSDMLSSRLAIGQGSRYPTSFFELEHAILSAPGVDRSNAKAERSDNVSYALNFANDRLAVTGTLNHTVIRNLALFVDDTANSGLYLLQPAASDYKINSADIVGTWQLTPGDALTAGYERYQYRFNVTDMQGSLFSRPKYKFTVGFDHDRGPWDFNARASYTSAQDLAKFYDYVDSPRYHLDGTPKPSRSPGFWLVDLHLSYRMTDRLQVHADVNNVLDYQQAKKDSFLWLDGEGALDVTQIWGPSIGRSIAVGLKLTF